MNQTIIFTDVEQKRGFFSIVDNRLHLASFDTVQERDMNKIYIGRVTNILPNLKAAFVEYRKGVCGFLPLTQQDLQSIKCEMQLPVQIVKEAVKTKEAVLSTELSLAGVYCVMIHKPGGITFSKKIPSAMKEELLAFCEPYITKDMTCIIRTNVTAFRQKDYELLKKEILQLKEKIGKILTYSGNRTVYSQLYEGNSFIMNQLSKTDFTGLSKIVTDGKTEFDQISQLLPADVLPKLELYQDASFSLQALWGLRGKLHEAVSRIVWLKSGGYLVVEPTEALTVIDVNSGKNLKKMSKTEMAILTNTEAAETIPYLLTSRNISGIIIVDFISVDMKEEDEKLLKMLRSRTAADYVKTNVVDITPLGLVEITRQKKELPLKDQLCEVGLYETIRH